MEGKIEETQMIPKLSRDVEILPFDNGGFLVQNRASGYRININHTTNQLLHLVDGHRSVKEITNAFMNKHSVSLEENEVHDILFKQLGKYHIIQNDEFAFSKKEKPAYLRLSFTVLKKEWISTVVNRMGFLFGKKLFYTLFFGVLFFMISVMLFNYEILKLGLGNLTLSKSWIYLSLFTLIIFLHEFGHAAACKKHGAEHGNIGFGFYLFSPVMFVDVSDAWKLTRDKRIIVNLGGIYIQLIIGSVIAIIYFLTGDVNLLMLAYAIGGLSVFYNLNPFFRTDGYWILSDMVGIANLRANSNRSLQGLLQKVVKKGDFDFNIKSILLALYALVSISFIGIFLFAILIKNPDSLINYPHDVAEYISYVYRYGNINSETLQSLLLPTLFYALLSVFCFRYFKRKILPMTKGEKKKFVFVLAKVIPGTMFLLSAVGKTLKFNSFSEKITEYGVSFIPFVPHIILLIEYTLAIGFMVFVFTRQTAKIALLFLIAMTLAYAFGHYFMDIKSCDCFGYFETLNPKNFLLFILKNSILIALCLFLIFNDSMVFNKIKSSLISILCVFTLSFFVYKLEARHIANYAQINQGKAVEELFNDEYPDLKKNDYWFLFSPTCPHCVKAIPTINEFSQNSSLAIVGIMLSTKKIDGLNVEFPIQKMDGKNITKLSRVVPRLFEIKNDTIRNVYTFDQFVQEVIQEETN